MSIAQIAAAITRGSSRWLLLGSLRAQSVLRRRRGGDGRAPANAADLGSRYVRAHRTHGRQACRRPTPTCCAARSRPIASYRKHADDVSFRAERSARRCGSEPFDINAMRDAMAKTRGARRLSIRSSRACSRSRPRRCRRPAAARWPTGRPAVNPRATALKQANFPSDPFQVLLKVAGMCRDRQGAGAGTKRRARPFVTMLQGLCLMLPLGGCLLPPTSPIPGSTFRQLRSRPEKSGGGGSRPAAARLVARLPLEGIDRGHRRGPHEQSRYRRGRRAHRPGRRAVARRRRAAAAQCRPQRQRRARAPRKATAAAAAAAPSTTACRLRSAPATRSTSGARTAPPCAPPRKARWPAATTARWSALATVVATANAYFQVLAAQDRLRVARDNLASARRVLAI